MSEHSASLATHAELERASVDQRPPSASLLVAALQLVAVIVWALHLYVRTLPPTPTAIPAPDSAETAWWGLWPITYLPWWAIWAGTFVLLAMISWWRRRPPIAEASTPAHSRLALRYYALAAVLLAAFFAFPIAHTRWGDAYVLANGLAWPDVALRLTHSWQAPLDVLLHSRVWLWWGEARGWQDAVPVYRLLSPVAGALFLAVVLALSADQALAPPWVTFGLLTTLGVLQLFFGYVENYSYAAAGVLAYLWLGMGVVRGRPPLWAAATVLAITNATHPSTIVLAPSLLYLGWFNVQEREGESRIGAAAAALQIGLPMALIAGATVVMMEAGHHGIATLLTTDRPGGGDARWFVPLLETQTQWEQYTMFSWRHLRDFLNQQLLVAPVVLPGLAVVAGFEWMRQRHATSTVKRPSAVTIFLLIAAGCYLLFTWVWNPDYGGQRDWDLFSLAALPLTLLLIVRLSQVLGRTPALIGGAAPLVLVQALHTAAWIYQNTLPWEWP
jgi:hypothetical protein